MRPRSATIMSMTNCQEIKILLTCSWLRHVRLSCLTEWNHIVSIKALHEIEMYAYMTFLYNVNYPLPRRLRDYDMLAVNVQFSSDEPAMAIPNTARIILILS